MRGSGLEGVSDPLGVLVLMTLLDPNFNSVEKFNLYWRHKLKPESWAYL